VVPSKTEDDEDSDCFITGEELNLRHPEDNLTLDKIPLKTAKSKSKKKSKKQK